MPAHSGGKVVIVEDSIPALTNSIHYYSDRLKAKLDVMLTVPATLVEAPSGYGKTKAESSIGLVADELFNIKCDMETHLVIDNFQFLQSELPVKRRICCFIQIYIKEGKMNESKTISCHAYNTLHGACNASGRTAYSKSGR